MLFDFLGLMLEVPFYVFWGAGGLGSRLVYEQRRKPMDFARLQSYKDLYDL